MAPGSQPMSVTGSPFHMDVQRAGSGESSASNWGMLLRATLTILGFYCFVLLDLLINYLSVSIDMDQEHILNMPASIFNF